MTIATEITAFETGKDYFCQSVCDSDCVWTFTIASRTAKTIKTTCGKTLRVTEYNGCETVSPLGRYSMSPILTADKLLSLI